MEKDIYWASEDKMDRMLYTSGDWVCNDPDHVASPDKARWMSIGEILEKNNIEPSGFNKITEDQLISTILKSGESFLEIMW